jgi:uncharacterized protein
MRPIFVDTSVIVALLNRNDALHHQAKNIILKLENERASLVITNYIRLETHALLMHRAGSDLAIKFLEDKTWHVEWVSEEDENKAQELLTKYNDKRFSLTDAVSFVIMSRLNISEAFTFDRHFQQYGWTVLI